MDTIDQKIMSQLQADGRTTLQELAKTAGYTSMGTKKRLERLLKKVQLKSSSRLKS